MNTSSRKVLLECNVSIIIKEPKRKRGVESEDEEALEQRGFRARVDLRLGAIDTTNVTEREGERKRQSKKSQYSSQ